MKRKRRIIPAVYLSLTLIAMTAMHFFAPLASYVAAASIWGGAVLLVAGTGIAAWAAGAFARAGTPLLPFEPSTALVVTGMYRVTRNPMYLGMVVALLGVALLFGTLGPLLPIPVFVWIIQTRFILAEENFLTETFGARYLAYRRSVRRWI